MMPLRPRRHHPKGWRGPADSAPGRKIPAMSLDLALDVFEHTHGADHAYADVLTKKALHPAHG